MTAAVRIKESERGANPMDDRMTPAQVARRHFKSALPRKPQNRNLSAMQALAETFRLLDEFRGIVREQRRKPDTVNAALAYYTAKSSTLAEILPVPDPPKIGKFCDKVIALHAQFLGVVFVHVDPDTDNSALKAVSFCVPFVSGPEADGRILAAQKRYLHEVQRVLSGLKG